MAHDSPLQLQIAATVQLSLSTLDITSTTGLATRKTRAASKIGAYFQHRMFNIRISSLLLLLMQIIEFIQPPLDPPAAQSWPQQMEETIAPTHTHTRKPP